MEQKRRVLHFEGYSIYADRLHEKRQSRWYFGGLASAGAVCFTHPLELLKVVLQTQQVEKLSMARMGVKIVKEQGPLALYNGLSASILRQLMYATIRFSMYEISKQAVATSDDAIPLYQKIGMAAVSGAAGGFVGTPGEVVNVRMQNDIILPPEKRRNYKHGVDGLIRVFREEGLRSLFAGASTATGRAVFMTIGQLSFYDQFKMLLLKYAGMVDNLTTHFLASLSAGAVATTLCQPIDVLKTRAMNAKPGEFKNLWHIVTYTAKLGPLGFYKGYIPAFIRIGPQTILIFIFLEQLRKYFGVVVPEE